MPFFGAMAVEEVHGAQSLTMQIVIVRGLQLCKCPAVMRGRAAQRADSSQTTRPWHACLQDICICMCEMRIACFPGRSCVVFPRTQLCIALACNAGALWSEFIIALLCDAGPEIASFSAMCGPAIASLRCIADLPSVAMYGTPCTLTNIATLKKFAAAR